MQNDNKRPLQIIPIVITKKATSSEYSSEVNFTSGFKNLATEKQIQVPETVKVYETKNSDYLISRLSKARAKYIVEKYGEKTSFRTVAEYVKKLNKVIKFSTSENESSKYFLLPTGTANLSHPSKAIKYDTAWSPLQILKHLDNSSGGKFYLQYYLNGTNNPVYYLQSGFNKYFAFQHRHPFLLHYNGEFNEYIAKDAIPIISSPEAGEVICLAQGVYTISKNNNLKGLSRLLSFYPDTIFPNIPNPPQRIDTILLTPKVQKARSTNEVRPFLSNQIASNSIHSNLESSIFDYTPQNIPFLTTGLKIIR